MGKKRDKDREAFGDVIDMLDETGIDIATAPVQPIPLPPSHDEDPLMTLSEVGQHVGKSPQTIARWIQDGLLEATRVGPLFKIRRSVLARFLGGTALQTR